MAKYSSPSGSEQKEQAYLDVDNSALLSVDIDVIYRNIKSFYDQQEKGNVVCVIDTPKERQPKERLPREVAPKEQGGKKITNL